MTRSPSPARTETAHPQSHEATRTQRESGCAPSEGSPTARAEAGSRA
ncbi:hypothetical protein [Lysinibacillus sp. OL1]|nr:hypothetical protein [Lysinibacillus sp. OL1]